MFTSGNVCVLSKFQFQSNFVKNFISDTMSVLCHFVGVVAVVYVEIYVNSIASAKFKTGTIKFDVEDYSDFM